MAGSFFARCGPQNQSAAIVIHHGDTESTERGLCCSVQPDFCALPSRGHVCHRRDDGIFDRTFRPNLNISILVRTALTRPAADLSQRERLQLLSSQHMQFVARREVNQIQVWEQDKTIWRYRGLQTIVEVARPLL